MACLLCNFQGSSKIFNLCLTVYSLSPQKLAVRQRHFNIFREFFSRKKRCHILERDGYHPSVRHLPRRNLRFRILQRGYPYLYQRRERRFHGCPHVFLKRFVGRAQRITETEQFRRFLRIGEIKIPLSGPIPISGFPKNAFWVCRME